MDNLTLAAANAFIQLYYSINLLITSVQRKSRSLRFISLGYLFLAGAFFIVFAFNTAPTEILALIFNLSFSLFFFMYFAGIRSFCGFKAWPVKYSLLLVLGYTLLTFVIILVPASFPRIAITSLLVVCLFVDLTVTIWPVWKRLRLVERSLSMLALIAYPGYLLVRLMIIYRESYADKFFTDASVESTVSQIFMMVNFSIMASVANLIDDRLLVSDLRHKNQLLEAQSIFDQLTGLYNRQYLEQSVGHEIIRSRNDLLNHHGLLGQSCQRSIELRFKKGFQNREKAKEEPKKIGESKSRPGQAKHRDSHIDEERPAKAEFDHGNGNRQGAECV